MFDTEDSQNELTRSNLIKIGTKDLNRQIMKQDTRKANKYMRACCTSGIIRKMQIEAKMSYY